MLPILLAIPAIIFLVLGLVLKSVGVNWYCRIDSCAAAPRASSSTSTVNDDVFKRALDIEISGQASWPDNN